MVNVDLLGYIKDSFDLIITIFTFSCSYLVCLKHTIPGNIYMLLLVFQSSRAQRQYRFSFFIAYRVILDIY